MRNAFWHVVVWIEGLIEWIKGKHCVRCGCRLPFRAPRYYYIYDPPGAACEECYRQVT